METQKNKKVAIKGLSVKLPYCEESSMDIISKQIDNANVKFENNNINIESKGLFKNPKQERFTRPSMLYSMYALKHLLKNNNINKEHIQGSRTCGYIGEVMTYKNHFPHIVCAIRDIGKNYSESKYIQNLQKMSPLEMLKNLPNISGFVLAAEMEIDGPAHTILNGCSSGLAAILEGANRLRYGYNDKCVVLSGCQRRSIVELSMFAKRGFFNKDDYCISEVGTSIILESVDGCGSLQGVPVIVCGASGIINLENSSKAIDQISNHIKKIYDLNPSLKSKEIFVSDDIVSTKNHSDFNYEILNRAVSEIGSKVMELKTKEKTGLTFAASGIISMFHLLGKLPKNTIGLIINICFSGYYTFLFVEKN